MTTYELYINDILCDLSSDEVVTLLYQSPIFSSLDSIQSNRSYNVALPPTPTNMQAIGQAARPDVDADAPYVRLPAALYQDGVPLFTQGFAVVTDIADTINVTLTWGNVDNFQPLFDNGLRDLGPQLEELEAERIDWNENTTILEGNTTNEYPGVAFWGVNFGMGLSNPKYLHPSVQVKTILSAIEKYNGITIDGKERLAYSKNLGPIIPLVSKNGDEISNEAEALRFTANSTNFKNQIYGVLGRGNIIKDPHEIAYGSCTTKFNKTDLSVHITIKPSNGTGAYGYFTHRPPEWGDPKEMHIMLTELDGNSEIVKSTILGTSYNVELVGSTGDGVNVYRFNFVPLDITYPLIENTEILLHYEDPAGEIYISNPYSAPLTVNIWANWTDCAFPTRFPVAPNLPDISQGDFILALMSMNGLFAYADKDSPNTIKLISIDDIIANVQNNDIIDWSDRVILNDLHRVDMPDASIFTIDDLAQSNILDYDNDRHIRHHHDPQREYRERNGTCVAAFLGVGERNYKRGELCIGADLRGSQYRRQGEYHLFGVFATDIIGAGSVYVGHCPMYWRIRSVDEVRRRGRHCKDPIRFLPESRGPSADHHHSGKTHGSRSLQPRLHEAGVYSPIRADIRHIFGRNRRKRHLRLPTAETESGRSGGSNVLSALGRQE